MFIFCTIDALRHWRGAPAQILCIHYVCIFTWEICAFFAVTAIPNLILWFLVLPIYCWGRISCESTYWKSLFSSLQCWELVLNLDCIQICGKCFMMCDKCMKRKKIDWKCSTLPRKEINALVLMHMASLQLHLFCIITTIWYGHFYR